MYKAKSPYVVCVYAMACQAMAAAPIVTKLGQL